MVSEGWRREAPPYPDLREIRAALEYIEKGHAREKVVITVYGADRRQAWRLAVAVQVQVVSAGVQNGRQQCALASLDVQAISEQLASPELSPSPGCRG